MRLSCDMMMPVAACPIAEIADRSANKGINAGHEHYDGQGTIAWHQDQWLHRATAQHVSHHRAPVLG